MGLSRLDNFLKSVRGNIIYVDPNSIDATDSIENQGNSLTRPFKTIQRALAEASRFSYQRGLDNDRFEKTTILLYPGDHVVDNRPGWIPDGANNYRLRNGLTSNDFPSWDLTTNFDLETPNNALYKLNSVHGGVIIPRGTSIIGLDLRKTRIRPKYVPNPENNQIERSAVFRVTGACYLWQFTVLDANPNGTCYKDYTTNIFVPNFSHHKLTAFEYADGANGVSIADDFQTYSTTRTDLQMYYEKIGLAYGSSSGREIQPDYPSSSIDIQPKIDEYRIVGSRGAEIGITSIKSGNGVIPSTNITVTLENSLGGLDVDTPIRIEGVGASGYDGQYVVSEVNNSTEIVYQVQNPPLDPLPPVVSATLNISVDTVTSASPYIFNISMRSVYGMCGLHADGDKADGFKSMVVAQFTGIGLQKDDNAFVKYNTTSGVYEDNTAFGNENIHTDSRARFKPEYENYHIKCSNDAYLQLVSVFAIGYANHFLVESGGDQSINNSNSNFGAKALVASGFRDNAFPRDDVGYITHVIPPKVLESEETTVEFTSIDVGVTTSVGISSHLYLYNQTNAAVFPEGVIEGYRIGAKVDETINVLITDSGTATEYSANIVMPNTLDVISEKKLTVGRSSAGINSITSNVMTLTSNHNLINGESVRVISNTGQLPDGVQPNQVYYAITNTVASINAYQIKIAQTLNDAIADNPITINNKGGLLSIVSRVSDKSSGDIGHPIQYDSAQGQWYVNVATAATANTIYSALGTLGVSGLGDATPRTYIKRKPDTRNIIDTVYRLRYVIPSDSTIVARPPLDGYVLQESNTSIGSTSTEVAYQFNPSTVTLSNSTELRNQKIIAGATWNSTVATITTELPHNLNAGSEVEILNVTSTNNTSGTVDQGYNGTFTVVSVVNSKKFTVTIASNPGTFTNDTSVRTTNLPYLRRKKFLNNYYIYRSQEVQSYIPGEQDGVYHLLVANASNSPSVVPFNDLEFAQPIQNLYPQTNRDTPVSDPKASVSFALPDPIGQVVINKPQNSITKESLGKGLIDFNVGVALTNIISGAAGTTHTFNTKQDHGLNRIISLSLVNQGAGYGDGTASAKNYFNAQLINASGATNGFNATARVSVSAAGTITAVKIMDGGSAYSVGDQLNVVGIATTTGFSVGIVSVTGIYNNVGDTLLVSGIVPETFDAYNNYYRITGISSSKTVSVASASTISPAVTTGLGLTVTAFSNAILTGQTLNISSLVYNNVVGLATVTTLQNHGLNVDNKVHLGGAENSFYNGDFVVKRVVSNTSFVINPGVRTDVPATTGNKFVYQSGFVASGGNITRVNENLGGRQITQYAGITTTLASTVSDPNSATLGILNATSLDLNIGDYLLLDEEIVRIKTTVTSSNVSVFRGLFGTRRTSHNSGEVVRRIKPIPIELRRNSLIRASGHTFEYLGFGPGNYSTAFPERQDRTVTAQEELLSQATKQSGGIVVFTGMNADGDFYVGNKKVSSATGQEEVFDAPVPTVTGEDPGTGSLNIGFDVLSPLEISVTRSLRVEGGPDANIISEFDGPVIFNNKITSTSDKGIEANSIFLQGDASVSRKYTVGISTPVLAGNPGDIQYNAVPVSKDYIGWVYTDNNRWEQFGYIGPEVNAVGISSGGTYVGLSTLVNFETGLGATITSSHDSVSGITTLRFQANPLNVGVGLGNTFVGIATQINFIGYGITVGMIFNAGIASVTLSGGVGAGGSNPGLPNNAVQYNDGGFFRGSSGFTFNGTNLELNNSSTSTLFRIIQTGTGNAFQVDDVASDTTPFVIANDGSVGIGTANPTAKVEVVASTQESVRIKSTSGSGNIVRVDNTNNDTTPVIIDVNGNVGINTVSAIASLDVVGNAAVTGEVRYYETDRTNYVSLQAPTLASNVSLTLPPVVGAASSVLYTTGSGILNWISPRALIALGLTNTDSISEGSTNLYFTDERAQDAVGAAINAGIQTGITVTYDDANNRINFNATGSAPYPFTTRGFGFPL